MHNITIRLATPADLKAVGKCQIAAFPKSFSSRLGNAYTSKMLEWFLINDERFLLVAEDEQKKICGYCGGFITRSDQKMGSSSGMTQHSFNAAIKALILRPWMIFSKEVNANFKFIFKNILRKLGLAKKKKSSPNTPSEKVYYEPGAGLVIIGTHPDYRGRGIAGLMLNEFENQAIRLGYNHLYLTVLNHNSSAIKAYEKAGWTERGVEGKELRMGKILPS